MEIFRQARLDIKTRLARRGDLAARSARSFAGNPCPRKQRAQGRPDARCTRGLMCVSANKNLHMSIQVQLATPGLPCAMALRLIRGRPGDRLSCHRHPADCSAKLDASTGTSGPHDFTVRNSSVRLRCSRVHRISPHVRDDRERPSHRGRRAELNARFARRGNRNIFTRGAGQTLGDLPVGLFCRTHRLQLVVASKPDSRAVTGGVALPIHSMTQISMPDSFVG
jgi:hypothetical protein